MYAGDRTGHECLMSFQQLMSVRKKVNTTLWLSYIMLYRGHPIKTHYISREPVDNVNR